MDPSQMPATRADIEALGATMSTALKTQSEELKALSEELKVMAEELKSYVREQVFDSETRLLRAFADYNNAMNIRFRKLEADVSNVDAGATQRLGIIEPKLTDLDIRMIRMETRPPAQTPPPSQAG